MQDWRPGATLETLTKRAEMLARVRDFFRERGVLEVDTPVVSRTTATDPHLCSMELRVTIPGEGHVDAYLQTSPELAMKRLLAAGSGPIYQIAHAFRDGEVSRRHNCEFTMLEWYRPGIGLGELHQDIEALVGTLLGFEGPYPERPYRLLFQETLGVDPLLGGTAELLDLMKTNGLGYVRLPDDERDRRAFALDLLFSHCVEPGIGAEGPCFVVDFPAETAALSVVRVLEDGARVAERSELFYKGVELANAYHELTDAEEFRRRYQADMAARQRQGLKSLPFDARLSAALVEGFPESSGVAMGLDRLLMLLLDLSRIDQAMAFSVSRS